MAPENERGPALTGPPLNTSSSRDECSAGLRQGAPTEAARLERQALSAIARLDYLGERVSSSLEEIRVARLNEGELRRIVRTLTRRLDARTSRRSFFEVERDEVLA